MIYLNAGNLWTHKYLDKVVELNAQYRDTVQVQSLFGSIAKLTPSARSTDRLPYLEWNTIDRYVDKVRKNGMNIRYTLNTSCIGAIQDFKEFWLHKLKDDVAELHAVGISEWTVTSPLLLMQLRGMFPDDFLEVSTIAEVSTPMDAEHWKALGANGVNISTNINRNFPAIEHIVETGMEVSILANEACLFQCPYRRECYNLSSHDSLRSEDLFGFYPFRYCNTQRMANPVEWLKARMVLPQWMALYKKKLRVNWFKVAYRTHPYETAIPILEAYMKQYHGGNYLDLWPTISHLGSTKEPKDMQYISCKKLDELAFIERMVDIGRHCAQVACGHVVKAGCSYCEGVLKKVIE